MADTQHAAQPALLRIVKASGPPTSQIQDAAEMLGIDLGAYRNLRNTSDIKEFAGSTSFAPKEEWILRWLLRKLKSGEEGHIEYRSSHDVWVLVWILLGRVPPKTVAKLFLEHRCMITLSETFRDIASEQNTKAELKLISDRGLRSDSSSTLQESPVLEPQQKGKKRKRDDKPTGGSQENSPAHQVDLLSGSFPLLPLIQKMLSLTTPEGNPDEISRHQMEVALKADSDILAIIMGATYQIINQVLISSDNVDLVESMLRHIHAVSQLWDMRSNIEETSANRKCNAAFSSSCLLAALDLTQTLASPLLAAIPRRQDCVSELEQLIARHVVLPTRASFFASTSARKGVTDANVSDSSLDALLEELSFFKKPVGRDTLTPVSKLVPRFLDIASRAAPRRSLRQQSIENPWLETLFVALSVLAGFSPRFSSPKNSAQSVEPLEELLHVASLSNLPLSLNLLRDYTSTYSRILDDTNFTFVERYDSVQSPCEWSLLAKMIRLGVDIFIPNSGVRDAESILSATLKKATILRLAPSKQADQYYDFITTNIIIPIMEGFARARDLRGFLDHWYGQLESFSVSFTEQDLHESSKQFVLWESRDLTTAFSKIAPSSFTIDQMRHHFAVAVQDLSSVDDDFPVLRCAMNRAVVVDSLLQAELSEDYRSSLAHTVDDLRVASSTAVSNLSPEYPLSQWRLWRFLRLIAEHWPRDSVSPDLEKEESLLRSIQMVPQVITRVLSHDETYKWQDFVEALEAFHYLTVSMTRSGYPQDTKAIDSATKAVNAVLDRQSYPHNVLSSLEWDGRTRSVDSHLRFSLAFAVLVAEDPRFLIHIPSETRQQLFRSLCSLARDSSEPIEREDEESEMLVFRCVWKALATYDSILSSTSLWEDFIQVQIAEIEQSGLNHVALDVLGSIPADFISRPRRTKVLDLLLQSILKIGDQIHRSSLLNIMALIIAMLDRVNPSALILTDGTALWSVIETMRLFHWDSATCTMLENVVMAVLGSLAANKSSKRPHEYCETFIKRIPVLMREYKTFYDEPAMLSLCKASIPLLWTNKDALLDTSLHAELAILRQEFVNTIISDLRRTQCDDPSMSMTNVDFLTCSMIDSLGSFGDLLGQQDHLPAVLRRTVTRSNQRLMPTPLLDISVQASVDIISTEILANKLLFELGTQSLSTTFDNLITILDSPLVDVEIREKVLHAAREITSKSNEGDLSDFLSSLSVRDSLDDTPQSQLFLVGIAASSLDSQDNKDSPTSTVLSSVFGDLTQNLPHCLSIQGFCLTIDCLDLILRSHARSVSQWNVDNVLGVIATVTSVSGPDIHGANPSGKAKNSGIIFGRLCDLMGSILVAHRKKIGGRFHLIVAALQGMLRCLFVPERRKAQSSAPALPPWIPVGKEVLGRDHAIQYARLLSMICDPTVSSVKRAKFIQAQNLTDETKKARGVAGQYLQYVVREYAVCQLNGRISPEVKSALMPGLYAVLDAMSRDGMRGMNAAMDSSSRAVFKSLYDDYRRFGKWDQS